MNDAPGRLLGRERELAAAAEAIDGRQGWRQPRPRRARRDRHRQERAARRRARPGPPRPACWCSTGAPPSTSATCRSGSWSTPSTTTSRPCTPAGSSPPAPTSPRSSPPPRRHGRPPRRRRRRRALPLPPRAALAARDARPREARRAAPRRPALGRRRVDRARAAPAAPPAARSPPARLRPAPDGARSPHPPRRARQQPTPLILPLSPLPHAASLELIGHVADAGLRERLAREAAGNPLYLQELARVARDPGDALPPTLLAAVRLEVAELPPASRALLDGAAVAGDPFDPELAAAAAGLEPADALSPLDRLVAADLVCATGDGRAFRFRHPLLRRAVYDAAPPAWRLAAHERVAAALAARGAGASVRAFHVEKCARPGDDGAVALLAEAAAAAASTAPATAARWYGAGARLLPHSRPGAPRRSCSARWPRRSPARAGCTRAARRCSTCSPCSPPSAPRSGSPSSRRPRASSTCSAATATRAGGCSRALEDAPPEAADGARARDGRRRLLRRRRDRDARLERPRVRRRRRAGRAARRRRGHRRARRPAHRRRGRGGDPARPRDRPARPDRRPRVRRRA